MISPSRDSASFVARILSKDLKDLFRTQVLGLQKLQKSSFRMDFGTANSYWLTTYQLLHILTDHPLQSHATIVSNPVAETVQYFAIWIEFDQPLLPTFEMCSLYHWYSAAPNHPRESEKSEHWFPWSLSCLTQNTATNLERSRCSNFSIQCY